MVTVGAHDLVTGGSSGVGLAIAMELSRLGCHVHIVARRVDALDRARRTIEPARLNATQQIRAYSHDVSSCSDVAALFDALRTQHAEPAIVVNSAGVGHGCPRFVDPTCESSGPSVRRSNCWLEHFGADGYGCCGTSDAAGLARCTDT